MALYTISDLHLPLGVGKPMDIFGSRWDNYVERIRENWQNVVNDDDTVVIPGDISWATYIEDALKDFEFINDLKGKKIIAKGNHDYWWTTMSKLNKFVTEHGLYTINFLQNNAFSYENIAVCGTRGWLYPESDNFSEDDTRLYTRECMRLKMSFDEGMKLIKAGKCSEIYAFLHYPPLSFRLHPNDMTALFEQYPVTHVFYGHLHGKAQKNTPEGRIGNVEYKLVSCDAMNFMPLKLAD